MSGQINTVTGGIDTEADVTVRLEEGGKTTKNQGAETDALAAAARAYLHALNNLLIMREKTAPVALPA